MTPDHHSKEEELKNREAALREREIKMRMRELEAELEDSTPVQPTVQHPKKSLGRPWYRRLPTAAKFGLIAVGVVIATQMAASVTTVLLLFGVGWACYKLFIERDRTP